MQAEFGRGVTLRLTTLRYGFIALLVLAAGTSSLQAQIPATLFTWAGQEPEEGGHKGEEPLASDRPDFTEASSTVGIGLTQLEFGYTYTHDSDAGADSRQHSYPEALLRAGMFADWFEFRIQYNHNSTNVDDLPSASATGAEDLYIGAKIQLTTQDDWLPEMSIMPQATVPTGADAFTAGEMLPGLSWLYGWDVIECISTGGSTQINKSIDDDGENYYEVAQSWTIGYTLTEHVGAYTEVYAFFPSGASTALPEYYFDGGFIFPVTNNLQFDIRAGVGLNEPADDFFTGAGAVVRW